MALIWKARPVEEIQMIAEERRVIGSSVYKQRGAILKT
jgi:hypothetical protein